MLIRFPYYYRKGKIKTTERFKEVSIHDIPLWLEKVRKSPYFDEFECYLFGSLIHKTKARDMDIFFTGEYKPEKLVSLMDYALKCAMDMKIKADIFYIPDYSYLQIPPNHANDNLYPIYSSYDFELEAINGNIQLFRDYREVMVDGLFRTHHQQYHQKSIDNGFIKGDRIKKLN